MTCSATGKKLNPLVIGKSAKPWSFPKDTSDLFSHVQNKHNKKAWMNRDIFTEYLNRSNNKMKLQKCNTLLLLDNCSSHPNITLSNVHLRFLPKGTTSELQPLDQGIIAVLKKYYQQEMISDVNEAAKEVNHVSEVCKKISVYDAIINLIMAWEKVQPKTIVKCFKKVWHPFPVNRH